MKIQILGTGCPKCKLLLANVEQAVKESGVEAEVEKVSDIQEILKFGIMTVPGLVIDGEVKSAGKVLSPAEITQMLKK